MFVSSVNRIGKLFYTLMRVWVGAHANKVKLKIIFSWLKNTLSWPVKRFTHLFYLHSISRHTHSKREREWERAQRDTSRRQPKQGLSVRSRLPLPLHATVSTIFLFFLSFSLFFLDFSSLIVHPHLFHLA